MNLKDILLINLVRFSVIKSLNLISIRVIGKNFLLRYIIINQQIHKMFKIGTTSRL